MLVAMWLLDTVNAPVASDSMRGASLYTAKKLFDHLLLFELPIPNSSLFRGLFFYPGKACIRMRPPKNLSRNRLVCLNSREDTAVHNLSAAWVLKWNVLLVSRLQLIALMLPLEELEHGACIV